MPDFFSKPKLGWEWLDDQHLVLKVQRDWHLNVKVRGNLSELFHDISRHPQAKRISFDCSELLNWDSSLLSLAKHIDDYCQSREIALDTAGLPEGLVRLLKLAKRGKSDTDVRPKETESIFRQVGRLTQEAWHAGLDYLNFLGEVVLSLKRWLNGQARFRRQDFRITIEETGPRALPIVTIISILVGVILAFVGAVQLEQFGAQIYVANLVGLAMSREMGAMMTAIIMAGRTGAAFASHLGTMQVNEEIDALKTMGISPVDFLVLPRILAIVLMMPLLTLYANLMGMAGGAMVAFTMMDLSMSEYFLQSKEAVTIVDFSIGLVKSFVFGILVAYAGCLRGMQCGRSAQSVGEAATSAVVTGIVLIIIFDALFTFACDVLGI